MWHGAVSMSWVAASSVLMQVSGAVAYEGGEIVGQVAELVNSLGENWKGVVLVISMLGALAGGPPIYVLRRIMDLQEKEGVANREAQRQNSQTNAQALNKLSDAVRQIEVGIAKLRR